MKFKKWNIGSPAEQDVALLRTAGYPYLLSTVLAARGITTPEAASLTGRTSAAIGHSAGSGTRRRPRRADTSKQDRN